MLNFLFRDYFEKNKIRVGRGNSAKRGNTSGKGNNGQNCRSGGYSAFRSAQKRWRQYPKYGIKAKKDKYQEVSFNSIIRYVKSLDKTHDIEVDLKKLVKTKKPIKVIGIYENFLKENNISLINAQMYSKKEL